ncbi:neurofilament medium polypeptide-like [Cydia fagiglandana]|uniref:neurofilament medium polypeptide-like n=1 Tax=Cydia fagiglandana TaxID=1458189 RepID=UPI002FEE1E9D
MARPFRIALDYALHVCESAKPCISQAWQYAKVEMVPPMTQAFFQGKGGKIIETFAAAVGNGMISSLRAFVTAIDAAAAQRKKALERALKEKQEKAVAEAKLAAEKKAKALAAAKAKQAEAAKAQAVKAKPAEEKGRPKSAEPAKPDSKTAPAAKAAPKPDPKKPDPKKSEVKKPEAKKPEAKKSEAKKPEAKKPAAKKPEAKKPDPPKGKKCMSAHAKSIVGSFRSRMQIVYELAEVYKGEALKNRKLSQLMELIKEKTERAAKSELAAKLRVAKGYYTLEMAPPSSVGELKKLNEEISMVREFVSSKGYKGLTVKQAWLLFLVGIEVGLWFFLGETIGKAHIVGYKVCP